MSQLTSVAASLSPASRKSLAIEVLSKAEPISNLAAQYQVSRKFLYQQGQKAEAALDEVFRDSTKEQEVLFYLPVTQTWLFQLILALVLICHCSYRGVVELMRDLFDLPISVGTIHNRLQVAAEQAAAINQSQDLSSIRVGLHDEIYQGGQPVLVGVDARSTYCYLLAAAEARDENTWGFHLLEAMEQGLNPEYTIADAAKGYCQLKGASTRLSTIIPKKERLLEIMQQDSAQQFLAKLRFVGASVGDSVEW